MGDLGVDAAVVAHPASRRYFTGFPASDHAPDESSGALVVTAASATLYTSPTNLPWAEGTVSSPVVARAWSRPWADFLGQQLREAGVVRAAFEDRSLTVADHAAIGAAAEGVMLVPAGSAFQVLRAVKDERELAAIAEAARLTDEAFVDATSALTAGITERELAWRIERTMRDLGADGPGFETIVASGPNSARPHHAPGERPLREGEPVIIDMGAELGGYTADLTRTICIGEAPPPFAERYNAVLAAQRRALAGIAAGMTGRDADRIGREALTASGMGEQFIHGLGHGVGLLVHEFPSLGTKSNDILAPGQVVTIEPGLYFDGWGGIRIEDLCLVTSAGLEVLSAAPK